MNARAVSRLDAALEACLLAAAFLVPLAVHLKAYDPYSLKSALLCTGALLAVGLWLARALEAGRFELPSSRALTAGLAAALLAWSMLRAGPAADAALARAAGPALFLAVLLGPGSASFARSLSWSVLASAAAASLYALAGALGFDPLPWSPRGGTLGSGSLLFAAQLCALPMAWPLVVDLEASRERRALAWLLAALCLAGLTGGAASLDAAALAAALPGKAQAMGVLSGLFAVSPLMGAGAGELSLHLLSGLPEAATALPMLPPSEPLATAAELGLPGALLWTAMVLGALSMALLEARRRSGSGDDRGAALCGAHAASLGLLTLAGLVSAATYAPAPGLWLWLIAGSAAALATERGSAVVSASAVPLPAPARRLLLVPLGAALLLVCALPAARLGGQLMLNRAAALEEAGDPRGALELYRTLRPEDAAGLQASLRAARLLLQEDDGDSVVQAREVLAGAMRFDPYFADALFLCAEADRRLKEWGEAERGYALYARLNPGDPRTYQPLAEMRQTLGDPAGAVASAQTLVRLAPEDPEAWRFYAETVHSVDPAAARPLFAKAAQVRDLASARKDARPLP
ncbi:MAG: hypothetical protein HY928_03470 [Elusimicrobia bacterium]|nr:hypothetical protein [Elusimicrobiota bacterium]